MPALQLRRQRNRAVARADESADLDAHGIEQPSDFAVAAFHDHRAPPAVGALAARFHQAFQPGFTIFQYDALQQLLLHVRRQFAQHAHGVFALDFESRMHHAVGQLAAGGENHQAFGIEVEPAHADPFGATDFGKLFEHGRAALGVVAADDLAFLFVIKQHADTFLGGRAQIYPAAGNLDDITRGDAVADFRGLFIDRYTALCNPGFHVAARADAGICQRLVQLDGRFGFGLPAFGAGFRHGAGSLFLRGVFCQRCVSWRN